MRRCLLAALALAGACGDNILPDGPPLVPAGALTILAHQDDDLILMQPDVLDAATARAGLTNVYVTAGNGLKGIAYAETRDEGLRAAYAAATGNSLTDWQCGWIAIAGHAAEHCRLADAHVSLVFLNYPDGEKVGEQPTSLLHLWEGTVTSVATIARRPTTYDQASLIATVAAVITATQPTTIRTLDVAATHGTDHSDHMLVGALATLALAQAGSSATLVSYRGYDIENEGPNTAPALVARSTNICQHYDACVDGCAPCGEACPVAAFLPAHAIWIARRYAVGFRAPLGPAQLAYPDLGQCLAFDSGGAVRLADCATAPAWSLTAGGALQSADRCAQVLPTGELVAAHCDPAATAEPAERWFVDDEGHVWSGVAPAPVPGMDYMHLACLVAGTAGGKAHTDLCGQGHAPSWQWLRAPVTGTYPALAAGPRVVLADVNGDTRADLVYVAGGHVRVLEGSGDGTFAGSAADLGALAIDPASLAVGEIDSDGNAEACGRDGSGVLCLEGGAPGRFSPSLASADAGSADPALAIVGHQICGAMAGGVGCSPDDGTAQLVASTPTGATALWAADLDGDGAPDGCAVVTAGSGLACAAFADRALARDVAPWSFSLNKAIDSSAAAVTTTALADIDGDGRADACDLDPATGEVACARSSAHGFGPRFVLLTAPPAAGAQLVLGDLDGDHRADACVIAGAAVTCALSP